MEKYRGFIVHAFTMNLRHRTSACFIGRCDDGQTFAVIESGTRPGFYLRVTDISNAVTLPEGETATLEAAGMYTMDGEACMRSSWDTTYQLDRARASFEAAGIRTYEADIRHYDRILIDRGIRGSLEIRGNPTPGRHVNRIFLDPDMQPVEWLPRVSCLSVDIETDPETDEIHAVGLSFLPFEESGTVPGTADGCIAREDRLHDGKLREEVLFVGPETGTPLIRSFSDEKSMLEAFVERVTEIDPDIITGWNVLDFDFRIIFERLRHHRIPAFLGRSEEAASYLPGGNGTGDDGDGSRTSSGGSGRSARSDTAIIPGRQLVDGLRLYRASPERPPDYTLETVAQCVLGYGKQEIRNADEDKLAALRRQRIEDPVAFCTYCVRDARLVIEILLHTGLLDLTLRRCLLTGVSLSRAWTSVAAFEMLYISEMHRRGLVAPSLGTDPLPLGDAPGGAILAPRAGVFDNVLLFDFRSLYPSIIRTFNIDPVSHLPDPDLLYPPGPHVSGSGETDEPVGGGPSHAGILEAPNGARFRREPGILPQILGGIFANRTSARDRGDEIASYVYKIIMNSFYGVLGTSGCRFAGSDLAGAITGFGHRILHWSRDFLTERGFSVLYGDTDSLFVLSGLPPGTPVGELARLGASVCSELNDALTLSLRERYETESYLELRFEKIYGRFFIPPIRGETGGVVGRSKGYAGLVVTEEGSAADSAIDVKGMEAIRRDWTELAQRFQMDLLRMLFSRVPADEIREYCEDLQREILSGRLDSRLIYVKALRKNLGRYTRSQPPHVKAAQLLPPAERQGLIRYVMTTEGPQPEGRTTAPIDYAHYLEKQIKPIAGSFSEVLGIDLENLFGADRQMWLFG